MPWKEANVSDLRMELVNLVWKDGRSITAAAEAMGVSRKTANKWLGRFEELGRRGLADQSRARRTQSHRTSEQMRSKLVEVRRRHPSWGPRKILDYLVAQGMKRSSLPAPSTVGEILRVAGLIKRRRRRTATPTGDGGIPAKSTSPNDLWTVDFKGDFRLGDGNRCYPLTIQDHHSRYVLQVRACHGTAFKGVHDTFRSVFQAYGVPRRILSDHGIPFAGTNGVGLSRLAVEWMKQGIQVERSRAGHPQDNGSHERMHRDLAAETTRPPCRTMRGQQHRFTIWRRSRNEERPHEALGGATPASVYETSEHAYKSNPPAWEYPGHWETRKVRQDGSMRWRGGCVFVSDVLSGERIGLEETDDGLWRLCYRRTQLGLLNEQRFDRPRVVTLNPWWVTTASRRS